MFYRVCNLGRSNEAYVESHGADTFQDHSRLTVVQLDLALGETGLDSGKYWNKHPLHKPVTSADSDKHRLFITCIAKPPKLLQEFLAKPCEGETVWTQRHWTVLAV